MLPRAAPPTPAEIALVPTAARDAALFRDEVMAERGTHWLGTVLLEPRVSHRVFAGLAALVTVAVIGLLAFGSYTRKAQVNGWLVPRQGLMRIHAPQAAVVTRIPVREGMAVAAGAPLIVLSTETRSEAYGATRAEIVRRLRYRQDSTTADRRVQESLFEQQESDLRRRLQALRSEQEHLAQELDLHRSRLALNEATLRRDRALRARDLITEPRLQLSEQGRLDQAARVQATERSRANLVREEAQIQGTLRELPIRRRTQLAEIDRNIAALGQDLAEAESRREIVLTAPQDGIVTAIQADEGGSVSANVPLMSVVPKDFILEAQLFSPSRAIGFVRPGQRVRLRYQPFPYQKFGFYDGTVASVSRSAVSPSELAQQLSGVTSLVQAGEPVYRITVDLARQSVNAYGDPVPLQPGMRLDADVMIESRRLFEWILDPLFTLTGKWDR